MTRSGGVTIWPCDRRLLLAIALIVDRLHEEIGDFGAGDKTDEIALRIAQHAIMTGSYRATQDNMRRQDPIHAIARTQPYDAAAEQLRQFCSIRLKPVLMDDERSLPTPLKNRLVLLRRKPANAWEE